MLHWRLGHANIYLFSQGLGNERLATEVDKLFFSYRNDLNKRQGKPQ